jgi:hypothetical protein
VLKSVAPQNLAAIPIDTEQPGPSETRPRAFEYYDFFASLTSKSTGAWSRINCCQTLAAADMAAARRLLSTMLHRRLRAGLTGNIGRRRAFSPGVDILLQRQIHAHIDTRRSLAART